MKTLIRTLVRTLVLTSVAACAAEPPTSEPAPVDEPPSQGDGSGTTGAPVATEYEGSPVRIVPVHYEAQTTGYWCGPTATKIALSARMNPPSQQTLANQLPTTTNGTDKIEYVERTLNANLKAKWFVTRQLPNDPPTPGQRDQLWRDLTRSVDNGFAFVANIVAPASNHPPGYPNYTIYHYFTVIGYNAATREVRIADPASFQGNQQYWLSFDQLATLIPPKGYTALAPCTRDAVVGAIGEKFDVLGGCSSVIGPPITEERTTPDGVGRYSVFERGSIYWTPSLGAHEVHGRIRDRWAKEGWEVGHLGYPTSDEYAFGDGRRSDFEHGYIQWSAATDTTTVGP